MWNWQQPDWPNFTWDKTRLTQAEGKFLLQAGALHGMARFMETSEREQLIVEILGGEALTTSEIEGEILNRDSVQSSIKRQFGLKTGKRTIGAAEQGIAEMTVAVYRGFDETLTHETLFAWHRMIMNGRHDVKDTGRYRTHEEAMQIISGPAHAPKIHFEAPPSAQMTAQMAKFLEWFNQTRAGGKKPLPVMTRAALAHLWFVTIHPFEDGNGRIARAIAEKALAQGLGQPSLTLLAETILKRRKQYYAALAKTNEYNQVSDWLAWCAGTICGVAGL